MTVLALAVRPVPAPAIHADGQRLLTWIDDVLADSFPASDPPPWTSGIARLAKPTASVVTADRPTRALLVSYVEDERALYGEALGAAGFGVRAFADPSQALDAAIEWQPDIVVTRILQPGSVLDGLELTRRIRQHPRTRSAAVLVITSLIAKAYRTAAAEAGADALVPLPCMPDELIAEIRRVAARRSVLGSSLAER
jgi:CheY-like chemotaxis protein